MAWCVRRAIVILKPILCVPRAVNRPTKYRLPAKPWAKDILSVDTGLARKCTRVLAPISPSTTLVVDLPDHSARA